MKEKVISALKWFYQSFIWLFIIFLAIDIVTKQLIIHSGLEPDTGNYIDWGFVHIGYILNYNAAFGLGTGNPVVSRILYLVIASLVSAGLVVYLILKRKETKLFVRACLVLIITGAVGNMIDRIFYAPYYAVVDWIDFYWFWGYNFNIADSCIVVAAFMMIIYIIVLEVKDMIRKRNEENKVAELAKKAEEEEKNDKHYKGE